MALVPVRRATLGDTDSIAEILGSAFEHDPAWQYCIRPSRRLAFRIGSLLSAVAQLHINHFDSVWITEAETAVAIWAPPGAWRLTPRQMLPIAPRVLRAAGPRSVPGLKVLAAMEHQHPDGEPHWYLAALGTHQSAQGKGHGSAVLQPVLQLCDDDMIPAYLESSKPENVPFYQRHGFAVERTLEMPPSCPPIISMWRELSEDAFRHEL